MSEGFIRLSAGCEEARRPGGGRRARARRGVTRLVLGGSGYLGRALVERWSAVGRVVARRRHPRRGCGRRAVRVGAPAGRGQRRLPPGRPGDHLRRRGARGAPRRRRPGRGSCSSRPTWSSTARRASPYIEDGRAHAADRLRQGQGGRRARRAGGLPGRAGGAHLADLRRRPARAAGAPGRRPGGDLLLRRGALPDPGRRPRRRPDRAGRDGAVRAAPRRGRRPTQPRRVRGAAGGAGGAHGDRRRVRAGPAARLLARDRARARACCAPGCAGLARCWRAAPHP